MTNTAIITKTHGMLESFFDKKPTPYQDLVSQAEALLTTIMKVSKSSSDYDKILSEIVRRYEINIGVKTFDPDVLVADPESNLWFTSQSEDKDMPYFNRYRAYLRQEGWDTDVIDKLQLNCEYTLSRCANPTGNKSSFDAKRRGMVMGDVQAGKTANYLGLINMARDYGYHVIILLAGLTDSLRKQTQDRVDLGFIGAYSNSIGSGMIEYVGVGEEESRYYAIPVTNSDYDFKKFIQKNTNFQAMDSNKPVILVVKKNAAILRSVHTWLNPGKNISGDSILIIDDEADNASPNTKKPGYDASAVNRCIRDIYNKFPIASYVGFTATPFANVFINPYDMSDDDQDLFPHDFIVQLNAPDTYFGGDKVFPSDGMTSAAIRILDTEEVNFVPVKHKKDYVVNELAESLKEAILAFLISNVIRTIRGDKYKHRSMMINVTALNDPQASLEHAVTQYINVLKNIIAQDSYKSESDFIKNEEMRKMYDLYMTGDGNGVDFYAEIRGDIQWIDIQKGMYDEIGLIETAIMNNRYGGDLRYDYSAHKEKGSRVIVIGGFVLSRGLTLEGLCISYYSRSATAYDTLLQMCRWFGYRPRYEDLCRVYLSETSIECFGNVLDAIKDMKDQFREMDLQGKTPDEFGLLIKESPATLETRLAVTARNKMYNTKVIEHVVNYGGDYSDTSKLFKDIEKNRKNQILVDEFIAQQQSKGFFFQDVQERFMMQGISNQDVSVMIKKISIPGGRINQRFDCENLSSYIAASQLFPEWDVVIAQGDRESDRKFWIQGRKFVASSRAFRCESNVNYISIGGTNNRIVDPNMFGSGVTLSSEEKRDILSRKKTKSGKPAKQLTAKDWLKLRERPLLVLYFIDLKIDEDIGLAAKERCVAVKEVFGPDLLVGFAVGFPAKEEKEVYKRRANLIQIASLIADDDFDEEELDDEQ